MAVLALASRVMNWVVDGQDVVGNSMAWRAVVGPDSPASVKDFQRCEIRATAKNAASLNSGHRRHPSIGARIQSLPLHCGFMLNCLWHAARHA
jgi:hypothetical protein